MSSDPIIDNVMAQANRKFLIQVKTQTALQERGQVIRHEQAKQDAAMCQRLSRATTVKHLQEKIDALTAYLRFKPTDESARTEKERLEARYKALLEEAG